MFSSNSTPKLVNFICFWHHLYSSETWRTKFPFRIIANLHTSQASHVFYFVAKKKTNQFHFTFTFQSPFWWCLVIPPESVPGCRATALFQIRHYLRAPLHTAYHITLIISVAKDTTSHHNVVNLSSRRTCRLRVFVPVYWTKRQLQSDVHRDRPYIYVYVRVHVSTADKRAQTLRVLRWEFLENSWWEIGL